MWSTYILAVQYFEENINILIDTDIEDRRNNDECAVSDCYKWKYEIGLDGMCPLQHTTYIVT
jgi:hypothetical protein